ASSEHRTKPAGLCFVLAYQPKLDLYRRVGVVVGQAPNILPAHEVDTRITDVPYKKFLISKNADRQSRRHPSSARGVHPGFVDLEVRRVKNLFKDLSRRVNRIHTLKRRN